MSVAEVLALLIERDKKELAKAKAAITLPTPPETQHTSTAGSIRILSAEDLYHQNERARTPIIAKPLFWIQTKQKP